MKKQHVAFLRWMFEKYGKEIRRTQFSELAFESNSNIQTVCNYVQRLEDTGCVSVEVINYSKRTIRINVSHCNALLDKIGEPLLFIKS